jgi:hypothetical protein
VGATLGAIGAQLPYPYVHIVYWTVQLLAISAVQYGCDIGVDWYAKQNGNGEYSPDTGTWPENQSIWWSGQIMEGLAGFTIFALFTEGIMNICAKLSNPLAHTDVSFSETVYGKNEVHFCPVNCTPELKQYVLLFLLYFLLGDTVFACVYFFACAL